MWSTHKASLKTDLTTGIDPADTAGGGHNKQKNIHAWAGRGSGSVLHIGVTDAAGATVRHYDVYGCLIDAAVDPGWRHSLSFPLNGTLSTATLAAAAVAAPAAPATPASTATAAAAAAAAAAVPPRSLSSLRLLGCGRRDAADGGGRAGGDGVDAAGTVFEWDRALDDHHRKFSAANAAGDYSATGNNCFSYVAQMVGVSWARGQAPNPPPTHTHTPSTLRRPPAHPPSTLPRPSAHPPPLNAQHRAGGRERLLHTTETSACDRLRPRRWTKTPTLMTAPADGGLAVCPGAASSQAGEIGLGGRRSWTKKQLCDAGISAAVEAAERHASLLKLLVDEGQHRHIRSFFECQLAPTHKDGHATGTRKAQTFRVADCPVCADYTGWQAVWVSWTGRGEGGGVTPGVGASKNHVRGGVPRKHFRHRIQFHFFSFLATMLIICF